MIFQDTYGGNTSQVDNHSFHDFYPWSSKYIIVRLVRKMLAYFRSSLFSLDSVLMLFSKKTEHPPLEDGY